MPAKSGRLVVYEGIRQRIESGEWPPGHQLPVGPELADLFGVSTGTVEFAVAKLDAEGWIVGRQGLGRFVADPLPST